MPTRQTRKPNQRTSRVAISRAVASSTAIETGESIPALERKLRTGSTKYGHLKLAPKRRR